MEKMMKECMKSHPLLHSVSGIGLGLLLAAWVPALATNAVMVGVLLVVLGVGGEFLMKK